jgi:hypothetical protein
LLSGTSFGGLRDAGRFAKAAFDRGRSEMSRVARPMHRSSVFAVTCAT